MNEQQLQFEKQGRIRNILRIGGVIFAVTGLVFIIISIASLFMSAGTFQGPRYFWCGFVGMPLLFVGMVMSVMGFFGAVQRYTAGESAPVMKDTINYLGENTKPGVTAIASAIREGLSPPPSESSQQSKDK